jgi:catechol 2,3-dioxygenase-like lactoylglutathione lyase family enzyme
MTNDLGIDRLLQVKVPVTDVATSARWYARLLDMRLVLEFVEDDELRGVVLEEPQTGARIALRDRAHASSHPILSGFDLLNFEMVSLEALEAFAERCDQLGINSTGVHHFQGGAGMDVPDPDGTAIRFHYAPDRPPFVGFRWDGEGHHVPYAEPWLRDIAIKGD